MRRLWWCIGIVVVLAVGCVHEGLQNVQPDAVALFRRCWPVVQVGYCDGMNEQSCRNDGEYLYAHYSAGQRLAWVKHWGCSQSVIDDR